MTNTLMSLGLFVFSLPTIVFNDMTHNLSVRFARNERFGEPDAVQFVGPGDEEITLSGVTAEGINDATAAFDQLTEMMVTGQAWPLVTGAGKVLGNFCIEGLNRTGTHFTGQGRARREGWTLTLKRAEMPEQGQSKTVAPTPITVEE